MNPVSFLTEASVSTEIPDLAGTSSELPCPTVRVTGWASWSPTPLPIRSWAFLGLRPETSTPETVVPEAMCWVVHQAMPPQASSRAAAPAAQAAGTRRRRREEPDPTAALLVFFAMFWALAGLCVVAAAARVPGTAAGAALSPTGSASPSAGSAARAASTAGVDCSDAEGDAPDRLFGVIDGGMSPESGLHAVPRRVSADASAPADS